MKGRITGLTVNPEGERVITLTTRETVEEQLEGLAGHDVTIDIKLYREKRSLKANGYMWALCDKLAEVIGATKEEVYRKAIREVGLYKDFEGLDDDHANTLKAAWAQLGLGWFAEDVGGAVRCYYGSSKYNSKQMARLLDYVIDDCDELGIETMTETELEQLKREWAAVEG